MIAQHQTTQLTRQRGPGTRLNPANPVSPLAMMYRPISACSTGLIRQLSRITQSAVNPTWAPSVVVAISSPDPTIDAARIIPGPIRFSDAINVTGGSSISSGNSS